MKVIFGVMILVAMTAGLFFIISKNTGWKNAVIIFVLSFLMTALIALAFELIIG